MTALMGVAQRLRLARLHLVTDTHGGGRRWRELCVELFGAGVDVIAIREPGIDRDALRAAVDVATAAALPRRGLVAVVGGSEWAGLDADAVQVAPGVSSRVGRAVVHRYGVIGRACTDMDEVRRAAADPLISFLTVGPTTGKAGLGLVADVAREFPVSDEDGPVWCASGGVTPATLPSLIAAGARRISLTRAITGTDDPVAAAGWFADRLREAWDDDESLTGYAFRVLSGGQR